MATMISLQHQASNGGGTTDEETEVQRGSLSRSTRESVREPGKNSVSGPLLPSLSLGPSSLPIAISTYSQRIRAILRLGQAPTLGQEVHEVKRVDVGVRWGTPCQQFP